MGAELREIGSSLALIASSNMTVRTSGLLEAGGESAVSIRFIVVVVEVDIDVNKRSLVDS